MNENKMNKFEVDYIKNMSGGAGEKGTSNPIVQFA